VQLCTACCGPSHCSFNPHMSRRLSSLPHLASPDHSSSQATAARSCPSCEWRSLCPNSCQPGQGGTPAPAMELGGCSLGAETAVPVPGLYTGSGAGRGPMTTSKSATRDDSSELLQPQQKLQAVLETSSSQGRPAGLPAFQQLHQELGNREVACREQYEKST
jgi:hypothetical protein